jgi:hypothetical protein
MHVIAGYLMVDIIKRRKLSCANAQIVDVSTAAKVQRVKRIWSRVFRVQNSGWKELSSTRPVSH